MTEDELLQDLKHRRASAGKAAASGREITYEGPYPYGELPLRFVQVIENGTEWSLLEGIVDRFDRDAMDVVEMAVVDFERDFDFSYESLSETELGGRGSDATITGSWSIFWKPEEFTAPDDLLKAIERYGKSKGFGKMKRD
jgi:hypothetical protein